MSHAIAKAESSNPEKLAEEAAREALPVPEAANSNEAAEDKAESTEEARAPVGAPENLTADAAREPIKPHEGMEKGLMPKEPRIPETPPPSIVHSSPVTANFAPTDALDADMDLKAAEVALAQYIGDKIPASLTPGLVLTLEECSEKGAGLKISLKGPKVVGNREELGEKVADALKTFASLASLFSLPEVKLHITKPHDQSTTVEIHINGMSVEQYKAAVRAMAATIPVVNASSVMQDAKDAAEAVAPPIAANANTIQAPAAAHEKLEAKAAGVAK